VLIWWWNSKFAGEGLSVQLYPDFKKPLFLSSISLDNQREYQLESREILGFTQKLPKSVTQTLK